MDKKNFLTVDVSIETLKKYCLWSIIKFFKDDYHIQNSSSRNDLLGGFMDRWINRIPESLIFQELLKSEEFDVVNDDFFYIDESAKNAPDVIGLVRYNTNNKHSEFKSLNDDEKMRFYQFYTFDINQWSKFDDDAPFIEMKTTRNSQMLATIAKRQENIDENYFVLVESNINDYYLLYLLDKKIFKEHIDFNINNSFFKNDLDIIELPNLAINNEINRLVQNRIISFDDEIKYVGDYKLCGIFKGSTIKDYSSEVGLEDDKPISPRYLKSIDEIYDDNELFDYSFDFDYYSDEFKSIPIFIDVLDNSSIFVENIDNNGNVFDDELIVSVEGEMILYDLNRNCIDRFPSGFYKLKFDSFISNLYKIYYFNSWDPVEFSTLKLNANRKKLDSGILSFYGDNFKNNKFDLKTIFDLNAEIYNFSKSTLSYKYCLENKIDDSKEIFCKMSFKNNGDLDGDPEGINPINKNKILQEGDENSDLHLNLRFEIAEGSKLRFLKRNKSFFIICVDNEVKICDIDSKKHHEIKNNYYKFEIKERSKNKKKYFEIIESENGNEANPDKNCFEDLIIDDKGFFIPDDINSNIKVKIDLINDSQIKIIKKMESEKKYKNGNKKTNYLYITVNGKAKINGKPIEDDDDNTIFKKVWKLSFDDFERTGKKTEYILSKNAIMYSKVSCENELINCFKNYIKKLDDIS